MGDNIHLGDRDGVRTPMQWTPDRNGGFSRADPAALVLPANMDALYGYETINVEAQTRDPHSLLHWMRRMLAVRRRHPALGRGALRFLYPKNRKVLAYLRELDGETVLCVANVSRASQAVELDLSELAGRVPVELSGGSLFPPIGQLTYLLTLPPYGFYWFVLAAESGAPSWHTPAPEPMPEYITMVFRKSLAEVISPAADSELEHEALASYLTKRRWFSAKDQTIRSARIRNVTHLPEGDREVLLVEVEAMTDGGSSCWQLPLSIAWDDEPTGALPSQLALARVRRGRRVGLLTDGFSLPTFAHVMLSSLATGNSIKTDDGSIRFEPTPHGKDVLARPADAAVMWLSAEQSNSSLIVDDAVMLKIFRRISHGQHPEAEMSRYLTERGFANTPPMLGEVVRIGPEAERCSLAVAQGFVRNQGDGWAWTLDRFNRAIDDLAMQQANADARADDIADYESVAAAIGQRLGEMHAVLTKPSDDAAFSPRAATTDDVEAWIERAERLMGRALAALEKRKLRDDEAATAQANQLLSRRDQIAPALRRLARSGAGSPVTRIHGDFHLGQVLVASGDAYIIDFEGEPARPLAERRGKTSPLRDVAGLIRSLDYAAASTLMPNNVTAAAVSDEARGVFVMRLRDSATAAFLQAYRASVGDSPGLTNDDLLEFFLIEKAAYEIAYEAANRPAWLSIPLHGLATLVDRMLRPAQRRDS
jgi:maltose alpha-D-glucosyltransferase/alpha-amylase